MLLDLFPELYERIVDEIADDRSVLRALALSCRSLRLSAQHALFRGVTLDATNHDSFLRCVQQTTNLGPLVRFLSIHSALPSKSYSGQPLRPESLSILLALLPNLQSLFLKHVEWTLASSATTRLFGARPCTSVVNLTLSECRIDFSTSLRIFLASFPNARTLEMDRSGSQRSGYATSVSQRRMDALQRWTVRGVCEGLTHVVPVLPTHGVRSIEVEIRSRESLEALRRACKISGPRLEELVVTLGPGAEATCRADQPSPLDLSSNSNLEKLRIGGLDFSRYWLSRHHASWTVDVLASSTSTRLAKLEYDVVIHHLDHLKSIQWDGVDRLAREKSYGGDVDVRILIGVATRDDVTTFVVDKTMNTFMNGTILRGEVVAPALV